jgi:hypothetical protein
MKFAYEREEDTYPISVIKIAKSNLVLLMSVRSLQISGKLRSGKTSYKEDLIRKEETPDYNH